MSHRETHKFDVHAGRWRSVAAMAFAALLAACGGGEAPGPTERATALGVSAPKANAPIPVTSASCTGPGSLVEAVKKANSTPGADTITFTPNLVVDADGCPDELLTGSEAWIAQVTDDLTIEGNGATLKGSNGWVSSNGAYTPLTRCPDTKKGDVIIAQTPGLFRVGDRLTDNSDLKVEIKNLKLFELEAIAQLYNAASLTLDGVTAERIFSTRACNRSAIEVTSPLGISSPTSGESTVVVKNNSWQTVVNWGFVSATPAGHVGAFSGEGNLAIENSQFSQVSNAGFISWDAGNVSIVSSVMDNVGGILRTGIGGDTLVVNSLWAVSSAGDGTVQGDRMVNASTGTMTFKASTILISEAIKSGDFLPDGLANILRISGAIRFEGSAIGVNELRSTVPGIILGNVPPSTGGFSADQYVWIQPVNGQGATEFDALFGSSVLTEAPGLLTGRLFENNVQLATPLLGTTGDPGKLLDVIPYSASDCTSPDGAKGLRNPIDGSCITKDVLGNPRFDGNGKRNIGAIQLTLAPSLQVAGTGDGTVTLAWTRPKDPSSGAITGYAVLYRPAGSTGAYQRVDVSGPDNLTKLISGLTNGTEYEFQVVGVKGSADGPPSNLVKATPYTAIVNGVNRQPDFSIKATAQANNPKYWANLGTCVKTEVPDGYGSVWTLTSRVTALILKSGTTNDYWGNPVAGMYGTASMKDISHVIVCTQK